MESGISSSRHCHLEISSLEREPACHHITCISVWCTITDSTALLKHKGLNIFNLLFLIVITGFSSFSMPVPAHLEGPWSSLSLGGSWIPVSTCPRVLCVCYGAGQGYEDVQVTLVDCPGHASLIRTIIGGLCPQQTYPWIYLHPLPPSLSFCSLF